jgi:hypothetical protein
MTIRLNPAETKVLNVLAARKAKFDEDQIEKNKIQNYAKIGGSTMRKAIASLCKMKLVTQGSGVASITKEGMQYADPEAIDIPTSNDAHHDKVKSTLNDKEVALFNFLQDGLSHAKKDAANSIPMEMNSTWRKLLAKLAKDNIVEHSGKTVRLHKDMFPIIPRPKEEGED